jgi:hypothetical protein
MNRSPIRAVSKKRAVVLRERRKLIAKHSGLPCEVRWGAGCYGIGATLHEPLLRSRGGDPASEEGTCWVCAWCHEQVHRNPLEATRRGFMEHSWERKEA